MHAALDVREEVVLRQRKIKGQHDVEDQIGVRRAEDNAEIVHRDGLVDGREDVNDLIAKLVDTGIAGDDGVHVDRRDTAELLAELVLKVVHDVVDVEDVALSGDFGVE